MALKLTLPDGKVIEVEKGVAAREAILKIGERLAKAALAVKVNGKLQDVSAPLLEEGTFAVITERDAEGLEVLRHTAAHVMAQAVKRLFPGTRLTIGPTYKRGLDEGFYYDFDFGKQQVGEKDLPAIEAEMEKVIKEDLPLKRSEKSVAEAIAQAEKEGESYKAELVRDIQEKQGVTSVSFYEQGEFNDLCRGPHLPSTGRVKAFKLVRVAGAYWRGDEKNPMLTRIYGTAFFDKKDLKAHLDRIEEATKRDHRKIGPELGLFSFHPEVCPGHAFWHPKGLILKNLLIAYWYKLHEERGYQFIQTPFIMDRSLWERSGHWENYRDKMYVVEIEERFHAVKPMNCPGCMLYYAEKPKTYRELPLKVGELGYVHRHEQSGELSGLFRVRGFTQDDAHIFMTPEQIATEVAGVISLTETIYKTFGYEFRVELSTRPEKSIGSDEQWQVATDGLRKALELKGLQYRVNEGDGAFYGPKIDFHLADALGRTHQCGTIQLDMSLPERFDLTYIGADDKRHRPVMVHRAIYGSLERFIGILVEHYAGDFPFWLSPVQVMVANITDAQADYARKVQAELKEAGFRVSIDTENQKIGYKIREATLQKIPYILVIGDKEMTEGKVALRHRKEGDKGAMSMTDLKAFLSKLNVPGA